MKKVLIISGGWSGHKPSEFASLFATIYQELNIEVTHSDSLEVFSDIEYLKSFDILMPNWTMGNLSDEQEKNVCEAVKSGINLVGVHGGAGDAFRSKLMYQWMLGGQFVGHPFTGEYDVSITNKNHIVCTGIPQQFRVNTEQYYMLIDPSIDVLAETIYIYEGKQVKMPVVWIKNWGEGKVFYSALGHEPEEYSRHPEMRQFLINGIKFIFQKG